jgi:hypothetical protein
MLAAYRDEFGLHVVAAPWPRVDGLCDRPLTESSRATAAVDGALEIQLVSPLRSL